LKKLLFTILGLSLSGVSVSSVNIEIDRAWMRVSDPLIMSTNFNFMMNELPLSGKVGDPKKYWSSDYWARYKGGINYRWNSSNPTGFNLRSPTQSQATQMSQAQLAALAPSEKWDLFIGRYDYPTKREVDNYASPGRPTWEGICDGWAGAAMNHSEPKPVTMTNPDGIEIPFGSSDIKGLLSWYYAKKYADGYDQMGRRCYGTASSTDRCTHDMNAGAFHIVLANKIGRDGTSFIADIDRNSQVWNHLAYNYNSVIRYRNLPPRSTSASGTVSVMRVRTTVHYVFLLLRNTWEPVLGTSRQRTSSRIYEYYLDINSQGKIIGGDWITTQRPDFLWLSRKTSRFSGLFSRLAELLDESISAEEDIEVATEMY
jgi:hypothetical protein